MGLSPKLSLLFTLFILISLETTAGIIKPTAIVFDMNNCISDNRDGSNQDYSELSAEPSTNGAVRLEVQGGNLYRNQPERNPHSCTLGPDGTPALCIAVDPFCDLIYGSPQAIRFDVTVEPLIGQPVRLESLSFAQQAPEMFSWINGTTARNNYPTKYSIRILSESNVLYQNNDLMTSRLWRQDTFALTGLPSLTFTDSTVVNIELLPYCAAGVVGFFSIWDIDNLELTAGCVEDCSEFILGGEVTLVDGTNIFYGCGGDAVVDIFNDSTLPEEDYFYLVADENNVIIDVLPSTGLVDLSNSPVGTYFVYGYSDPSALDLLGNNISSIINADCQFLTRSFITVLIQQPNGGTLTGGPFDFCISDGSPSMIPNGGITITGATGGNRVWVVTDETQETIIATPFDITEIDFNSLSVGTCYIFHLTFEGWLKGLVPGNTFSDVEGSDISAICFDLSNPIRVTREAITPSVISGGPVFFCTGDGSPDVIEDDVVTVEPGSGSIQKWVVTHSSGIEIFHIVDDLSEIDFEDNERGSCDLWHITYNDRPEGLEIGGDFTRLEGCFGSSNFIEVVRNENNGGLLTGDPFVLCLGDGLPDFFPTGAIEITDTLGGNKQWILADESGSILALPENGYEEIDFENQSPGTCYLMHLSYDGNIMGLGIGSNVANLTGCISLSNRVQIDKLDCNPINAGVLTGSDSFSFCTSDGSPDLLTGVGITGNTGEQNQWILTDGDGAIIEFVDFPNSFDFEGLSFDTCILRHVTYDDVLQGFSVGESVADLDGDFALSMPIIISKVQPQAGNISGGPFQFCVGDQEEDRVGLGTLAIENNTGQNGTWIVTDRFGATILDVADNPNDFNFEEGPDGNQFIMFVSYEGVLTGLEVGNLTNQVIGCFDMSSPVMITRQRVEGGILESELGFFEFCVGDNVPDFIPQGAVDLVGNVGDEQAWVVTNVSGTEILQLPDSPYDVDFDSFGLGNCVLWSVSWTGSVSGLEVGRSLLSLDGCASLSSFISIFRYDNTGGSLEGESVTFCINDGMPDFIDDGSITVSGNSGANNQWVITDENQNIIALPLNTYADVDFSGSDPGICYLYHLSYDGVLGGLSNGTPIDQLDGCFSLSDRIAITKENCPIPSRIITMSEVHYDYAFLLECRGDSGDYLSNYKIDAGNEKTSLTDLTSVCGEVDNFISSGEIVIFDLEERVNRESGELALYGRVGDTDEFDMIQYVAWGGLETQLGEEAMMLGLWEANAVIPEIPEGQALIYNADEDSMIDWETGSASACATTSVKDNLYGIEVNTYPNPAINNTIVRFAEALENDIDLHLYNHMGQKIRSYVIDRGTDAYELDLSDMVRGLYLIEITDRVSRKMLEIVKL